jgi:hypothetical protein
MNRRPPELSRGTWRGAHTKPGSRIRRRRRRFPSGSSERDLRFAVSGSGAKWSPTTDLSIISAAVTDTPHRADLRFPRRRDLLTGRPCPLRARTERAMPSGTGARGHRRPCGRRRGDVRVQLHRQPGRGVPGPALNHPRVDVLVDERAHDDVPQAVERQGRVQPARSGAGRKVRSAKRRRRMFPRGPTMRSAWRSPRFVATVHLCMARQLVEEEGRRGEGAQAARGLRLPGKDSLSRIAGNVGPRSPKVSVVPRPGAGRW